MLDTDAKIVKIFLPENIFHRKSHENGFLFGKINSDFEHRITCFITSLNVSPVPENEKYELVGFVTNKPNQNVANPNERLLFEQANNTPLKLKDICLDNLHVGNINYKIQIILYNLQRFKSLKNGQNYSQSNAIFQLIELLQSNENEDKQQKPFRMFQFLRNRFFSFLLLILTYTSNKILNFNESVFLRHLSIWANSLHRFTFKR